MQDRTETLKHMGQFLLVFSLTVLLLGRHYGNFGLVSIATGLAILGLLCVSDRLRHPEPDAIVPAPRPSGGFRRE
jgi:hypothetical protein